MNNDLKPIPRFCSTLGQLPTSYLMSMTYLEQVTWICNYINKNIIPLLEFLNSQISGIPEFEEEVNKKLNEFEEILNSYVSSLDDVKEDIKQKRKKTRFHDGLYKSRNQGR